MQAVHDRRQRRESLVDDDGKPVLSAPGKDSVLIVDLANPESPQIVATLPLKNSIVGPPVNLDIDPTGSVALVADSVDVTKDGDALKQVLDNKIYVIDLKANPPKVAATVTGGKQPSGLSFSPSGKMALVANRGDNSVSVLSVNGTDVKVTDTIAFPDSVAHVVFTPDGKRALAVRFPAHKVSVLDIAGDKVTYNKVDLPTGQWPYNVVVSPNGQDRADLRQWRRRIFRRQRRHHQRDRSRSQPATHPSIGWWSVTALKGWRCRRRAISRSPPSCAVPTTRRPFSTRRTAASRS